MPMGFHHLGLQLARVEPFSRNTTLLGATAASPHRLLLLLHSCISLTLFLCSNFLQKCNFQISNKREIKWKEISFKKPFCKSSSENVSFINCSVIQLHVSDLVFLVNKRIKAALSYNNTPEEPEYEHNSKYTELQHTSWNQKVEGLETVRKRARCPQGRDVRPRAGEVTKGSNFKQVHSTYCKPYWQQGVQGFLLHYTNNKQSHRNVPVLLAATGPQVFKAESRPQYSKTITSSQKGKRIKNRREFHVPYCIQLNTTAFCIFTVIFSNRYHSRFFPN